MENGTVGGLLCLTGSGPDTYGSVYGQAQVILSGGKKEKKVNQTTCLFVGYYLR